MDIVRDVLDNQILDRNQCKMGKVDGIIIELKDGQPPRLTYLETGATTLAQRLHPVLSRWVAAIERRWGAKNSQPYRIPWSKIRDIGINVEVDIDAEQTSALSYEQWLRERVIKRISGETGW